MKARNRAALGIIILGITALIWGVAFVAQSVGMRYMGPYTFNCLRFFIGAAVLMPLVFSLKHMRNKKKDDQNSSDSIYFGKNSAAEHLKARRKNDTITGGLLCGFFLFVSTTLQQFGIKYTSAGKAGFITALYIIFVPLFGLFIGKKIQKNVMAAAVLAVLGMYLLCMTGQSSISKGDILVFLCAIGFSFHILVIAYYSPKVSGVSISCIQFFVAAVLSGTGMMIFETPNIEDIIIGWRPVLYAGVLSCGVAYTLQIIGQKYVDPSIACIVLSLESVFSALAGWLLLKEIMTSVETAGCIIVFTAVVLAQLKEKN